MGRRLGRAVPGKPNRRILKPPEPDGEYEWWHPKKRRYWINPSECSPELPSYSEVASALLCYDQVVVTTGRADQLAAWLDDPLTLDLVRLGMVGFVETDGYPSLFNEDLIEHGLYETMEGVRENGDYYWLYSGVDNRYDLKRAWELDFEIAADISNNIGLVDLVTHHGLTANLKPGDLDFLHLVPMKKKARAPASVGAPVDARIRDFTLGEFGIPCPTLPTPDELMRFREAKAHAAFCSFIERVHRNAASTAEAVELRNEVIDEIERQFQRHLKHGRYHSVALGTVSTAIDLGLALHGFELPVSTTLSLLFELRKKKIETVAPSMIWRSFFREWSGQPPP